MGYKFNPLNFIGLDLAGGSSEGTYKAPVADEASLSLVGNTDGDVRVTLDTDTLWIVTGKLVQ